MSIKPEESSNIRKLLRDIHAAARLGISKSHFRQLVKNGRIPQPIKLGRKCAVWRSEDIQKIIDNPEKFFPQVES